MCSVRFSRLSRIRRLLGHSGPSPWQDADKIAVDKDYMVVDIVINWAADGLVLCFIHAHVDLDELSDNNEHVKSEWTNWCGTPYMPPEQIQLLFNSLIAWVPQPRNNSSSTPAQPTRVFQILSNAPSRPLLVSWPPDPPPSQPVAYYSTPTGRDFAQLADGVNIGAAVRDSADAKTSCTRRYKSMQPMPGLKGEVESIFIPHGASCFS